MHQDSDLVPRICAGDLEAFEALYLKYRQQLFRTALALTGDNGAAEEALQDCFVRAYAAMERVDASVPLGPWLHRIIVNLSYNWRARHKRWPAALEPLLDCLAAGPAVSPEALLEGSELRDAVQEAIGSLSFGHRAVVVLYYFQGFSLKEIGYILQVPLGTVKSRLNRACHALRARFREDRRVVGELGYVAA